MALARYQGGSRSGRSSKSKRKNVSQDYANDGGVGVGGVGDKGESDDELPLLPRPTLLDSELPPKYWFVLKVVKYVRVSPQTKRLSERTGLRRRTEFQIET